MLNNVQFKAKHIDGFQNGVVDSLSRFQMSHFRSLAPSADSTPTEIPEAFLILISTLY